MELYKAAAQQSSIEMNTEVLRLCQLFARRHLAMRNRVLQGVTFQYDAHDERNIAWAGLGCSLSHTRSHARREICPPGSDILQWSHHRIGVSVHAFDTDLQDTDSAGAQLQPLQSCRWLYIAHQVGTGCEDPALQLLVEAGH